MEKRRIFALDYGRGTMAGFYMDVDAKDRTPKPIMDKDGESSGFIKMKDGSYRLGRQLYTMPSRDYHEIEKYHLNIKEMPDGNDALQVEYAAAWRRKLIGDPKNKALFADGCEEVWIIGCPTGWRSRRTMERYRAIFERAGFPDVIIVPESNAAMMYAQQTYGFMDRMDENAGVLCIDLGAYSSDSTFIRPGVVRSYGGYVGASLIERMVLAMNLNGECCVGGTVSDGLRKSVRLRCGQDEKFRELLLLHAKNLKENYFNAIVDGMEFSDGRDCVESVDLRFGGDGSISGGERFFGLVVNDEMMHAIVEGKPVKSILGDEYGSLPDEVRNELGDKTWLKCLEEFIGKTLEVCPEFAKAASSKASLKPKVILTGGASLMPFVYETLMKAMPNAEVYADREPMSTIAKGLTYFGPEKLKARDFDEEFHRMLNCNVDGMATDGSDRIVNVVASRTHDVLGIGAVYERTESGKYLQQGQKDDSGIVYNTASKMHNVIFQAITGWREGNFASENIVSRARELFKTWFDDSMPDVHGRGVASAKSFIVSEMNRIFAPLLAKHGVSGDLMREVDVNLAYSDDMLEWWRSQYQMFDRMIAEKGRICNNFPNPDSLVEVFGKSREAIYDKVKEEMCELFARWRDDVKTMLKEEYDSAEVYGPFRCNCEDEITRALVRAKKTKLGELIVEESFDEED